MEEIVNPENKEKSVYTVGKGKPPKEWQFKKGQSGNPGGRPKGSLKDYMKRKLAEMPEGEKDKFLKKIAPELQWRMAEGNPSGDDKLSQTIKIIIANEADISPDDNSEGQPPI